MAYDAYLAERVRLKLQEKHIVSEEKKMMGGLCFMVDEKMCLGVMKNELMVRIAPEMYDHALTLQGSKIMDFTGRVLKGFLLVEPEGIDLEKDLDSWVQMCLNFNPIAKASKKKKK